MNTLNMQLKTKAFMLASGFKVEKIGKSVVVKPRLKQPRAKKLADREAEAERKFLLSTRDTDIHREIVLSISKGFVTVDQVHQNISMQLTRAQVQRYCRRVSFEFYVDKKRDNRSAEHIYAVTEKGLKFIGVDNA